MPIMAPKIISIGPKSTTYIQGGPFKFTMSAYLNGPPCRGRLLHSSDRSAKIMNLNHMITRKKKKSRRGLTYSHYDHLFVCIDVFKIRMMMIRKMSRIFEWGFSMVSSRKVPLLSFHQVMEMSSWKILKVMTLDNGIADPSHV